MSLTKPQEAELMPRMVFELTPDAEQALLTEAAATPSMINVCARTGVSYRRLRYWLQLGREGDERYRHFAAEFDRVRSTHENKAVQRLEELIESDDPKTANARLRAIEFYLKKFFPTQYADHTYVTTMIEQQADGFDLSVLPAKQLREFTKTLKLLKAVNEGESEEEIERLKAKLVTCETNE